MAKKTLAVVGLGYVGLPVAAQASARGWHVLGIDIDKKKVAAIEAGTPLTNEATVRQQLRDYPILASVDPAVVEKADVIIVAVPTPVTANNQPDLEPLKSALVNIRDYLRMGQVLIIESTINPGITTEVLVPLLRERADLMLDIDQADGDVLYIVHCPERINPGDPKWHVANIPRVLGGYSAAGAQAAARFYNSILDAPVKIMKDVTEAEAVKILENTFRDINIAFVNEMAQSFSRLGINVTNVIAGAATKPFAFLPHYPGNGVGGHCISVDPYYMIERARQVGFDHRFLKLAREINDGMPAYVVEMMMAKMKDLNINPSSAKVALLGLAYKKDIDDIRESPATSIQKIMESLHLNVTVFDPFLPKKSTVTSLAAAITTADVIMLATDHTEIIKDLTVPMLEKTSVKLVVDGKNALDPEIIEKAGIVYVGVGR